MEVKFVRENNTPVVTDWVGVTTNDIGKVMWYRTDATGKILKNQFIQIGTNIYYLDNNGIMVTGQYTINGKVYNFETAVGATEGRFLY